MSLPADGGSYFQKHLNWILQHLLEPHEERDGILAIGKPMVVG